MCLKIKEDQKQIRNSGNFQISKFLFSKCFSSEYLRIAEEAHVTYTLLSYTHSLCLKTGFSVFGFQVEGPPCKKLCLGPLIDHDGPEACSDLSTSFIGKSELHFLDVLSYGRALHKTTFICYNKFKLSQIMIFNLNVQSWNIRHVLVPGWCLL